MTMQIEKHISELLHEHDCVIIPGFGGFVCNYSSAVFDSSKNQFHPPFKKISFNRNLKNNDGLLANLVSQQEKISYTDANRIIEESILQITKELASGRRFGLKDIGAFYIGDENTLLFEQDHTVNYLPEAFGLTTFHSPAIRREPLERKIEKKLKDKIIIPSKEKKEATAVKKRTPVIRYIAAAASLLLAAALIFISVQTGLLKNVNMANLNPFASKVQPLYHSSEVALPVINSAKENISDALSNDTLKFVSILLGEKVPVVVQLKENEASGFRKTNNRSQTSNQFHIIGGAFAVPANAERFCRKLIKQGYDATVIEKKGRTLRFVSYGNFPSREDALPAIEKIRAVQNDVWLMKN